MEVQVIRELFKYSFIPVFVWWCFYIIPTDILREHEKTHDTLIDVYRELKKVREELKEMREELKENEQRES